MCQPGSGEDRFGVTVNECGEDVGAANVAWATAAFVGVTWSSIPIT
jgi:hypothetical protein